MQTIFLAVHFAVHFALATAARKSSAFPPLLEIIFECRAAATCCHVRDPSRALPPHHFAFRVANARAFGSWIILFFCVAIESEHGCTAKTESLPLV
jgi:hypothetical protein